MKKSLVTLSAISMSVFLSACGTNSSHNMAPGQTNNASMSQEAWNHDHMDHMKIMTHYYFDQMDTNHDGVVSLKEFMNFQRMKFRDADTNGDGFLTQEEVTAQAMREKEKMKEWKMDHMNGTRDDMHYNDMHHDPRDMNDNEVPEQMDQGTHY